MKDIVCAMQVYMYKCIDDATYTAQMHVYYVEAYKSMLIMYTYAI